METIIKPNKPEDLPPPTSTDSNLVNTNSQGVSANSQGQEIIVNHAEIPSPWHTLGRLLHETIFILFFIGIHWLIKWWLIRTGQDHEWWAVYLLTISIIYAVIAFTVIFGSELVVDCKRAIVFAWKNIRK